MIGFKNDSLEVLSFYGKRGRKLVWLCRCKCGKEIRRLSNEIKMCRPKSCGCYTGWRRGNKNHHAYHTKHGMAHSHPLYRVWKNMKQRCYNPNNQDTATYLGKGIKVCPEWKDDFRAFYDWAVPMGWSKGLSIDRIDSARNYCPENCRFVTPSENSKKVFTDNPSLGRGVNHRDASLSEDQVKEIKLRLTLGEKQTTIARDLKINSNIVWQIKNDKTWKNIPWPGANA